MEVISLRDVLSELLTQPIWHSISMVDVAANSVQTDFDNSDSAIKGWRRNNQGLQTSTM